MSRSGFDNRVGPIAGRPRDEWCGDPVAHLRDEIDLPTLQQELIGVVQQTMQPAHVSLWIRPSSSMHRSTVQGVDQEETR